MKRRSILSGPVAVVMAVLLGVAAFGPSFLSGREIAVKSHGAAPEFVRGATWLNAPPLTMAELKGKVVLVQFWTFSCINWLRTLPFVQNWYDTYRDKGFVVVGVHAPEFMFEHDTSRVAAALEQFGITYPVVQDNQFQVWRAYSNNYWPAAFLIDRSGKIVAAQIGEGNYAHMESAIAKLVGAAPPAAVADPDLSAIATPEMYFGAARNDRAIVSVQPANVGERRYSVPKLLPLNRFALGGAWTMGRENATLAADGGEVLVRFRAQKVHLVAGSASPQTLSVAVDDTEQPPVTVDASRLYTIFSGTAGEHVLRVKIPKAGLSLFTVTFG